MASVTFITSNPHKADFLTRFLDHPMEHYAIELDEIQSPDYRAIAEHKARQGFYEIKSPVLVESVGLSFEALGERLPGSLIKWLIDAWGTEKLCRMLDGYKDRAALGEICFAYFDGEVMEFFEGSVNGRVADRPRGSGKFAFGWNPIFIPKGSTKTYAQMNEAETVKLSLHTTTVYPKIKEFLQNLEAQNQTSKPELAGVR